jgi:cytochrome c-type biogenesis protein CcmH/NrfG
MSRSESEGTTSSPEPTPRARETDADRSKAAPAAEVPPHASAPSAEPKQELTLSESTLHWMVDSEKEAKEPDPAHAPWYDVRAQLASRRRLLALLGAAGGLALIIALVLHLVASHRAPPVDESIESASQITRKAENALSQGRTGEAIELAHLAIATNPRVPGAYAVVGSVARAAGRMVEARNAYTKYLELAPGGPHATEARVALAALPP